MEKRELRLKQLELKESEFQRHLAAQLQVENYLFSREKELPNYSQLDNYSSKNKSIN